MGNNIHFHAYIQVSPNPLKVSRDDPRRHRQFVVREVRKMRDNARDVNGVVAMTARFEAGAARQAAPE